jgi:hypothetical protein
VDALRYGEDNIRALIPQVNEQLRRMANAEIRELRADTPTEQDDTWVARQRRWWETVVEGL